VIALVVIVTDIVMKVIAAEIIYRMTVLPERFSESWEMS